MTKRLTYCSFWGDFYKQISGNTQMTQGLSIVTGCTAGGTEAIVVVPFEWGSLLLSPFQTAHFHSKARER